MKNTGSARIIIIGAAILVVALAISAVFSSANKGRRTASRSESDSVSIENDTEQIVSAKSDGNIDVTEQSEETESSEPDQVISEADLEKELLDLIKEKSGLVPEQTEYLDLNMDGKKEMVALCGIGTKSDDADRFKFQLWFCNNDKTICEMVEESVDATDYGELVVLQYDNAVHIVKNIYNMTGTLRYCSICEMQGDELKVLVSDLYGNIYEDADRNVMLLLDDYDGVYEPEIDGCIGHTTKDTYLAFDGKEYKEYAAIKLSEQEFSRYENAKEVKEGIEKAIYYEDDADEQEYGSKHKRDEVDRLEYTYYKRDNGILQIQCDIYKNNGEIYFGYYTVKYNGNKIDADIDFEDCYRPGIMKEKLTDLEAAD